MTGRPRQRNPVALPSSLLHALTDPSRPNKPQAVQLKDVTDVAAFPAGDLLTAAADARRVAETMASPAEDIEHPSDAAAFEWWANKSFFRGRPIVPTGMDKLGRWAGPK